MTTRVDIQTWAAGLDSQVLDCRARRHAWQSHRVTWDRRAKQWDEHEVCDCGCQRHTTYDRDGYIAARTITYPDDYLAPRGIGRLDAASRAAIRRERLSRARPVRRLAPATPRADPAHPPATAQASGT